MFSFLPLGMAFEIALRLMLSISNPSSDSSLLSFSISVLCDALLGGLLPKNLLLDYGEFLLNLDFCILELSGS